MQGFLRSDTRRIPHSAQCYPVYWEPEKSARAGSKKGLVHARFVAVIPGGYHSTHVRTLLVVPLGRQSFPLLKRGKEKGTLESGKSTSPSVRGSSVCVCVCGPLDLVRERSLHSDERQEGGSCREKETQNIRDRDREVQQ
jgi:hypothetical protein